VSGERGSGRSRFVRQVLSVLDVAVRDRLWVHDDDRELDQQAQTRLAATVSSGQVVPLIVTAAHRPPSWLHLASAENEPLRVMLRPFDRAAMLKIVQSFLNGRVDPTAVPVLIPHRAGGDLVVLREALREIQASGALVESGGEWRFVRPIQPLGGVRGLIFHRLGIDSLRSDALESALDVVGLAPELGLERTRKVLTDILEVDPSRELELLESTGVIDVVEHDEGSWCRLHDPVVERFVPLTLGRLRRRRLSNAIIEALSDRPASEQRESELLAFARLALPLGWSLDGITLTRAAETALRSSRIVLAGRLATAALATGAPVEASFVLAAAESQLGRSSAALVRLEALPTDDDEEPLVTRTRLELTRLVSARAKDPKTRWSLPVRTPETAGQHRSGDAADLAPLSDLSGGDGKDSDDVLSGSRIVDYSVVLQGEQAAFEASLKVMQGKSDEAIASLRDAESRLRDAGADTFRVRWGQAYSRMWDQPFGTTYDELSLLADEAASLGQAEQEVLCRWSAAWTLGYAGRAAEAIRQFQTALVGLERHDLTDTADLARIALAKALAGTGQDDLARTLLDPALRMAADNPMLGGWAHEAHGWVLRGSGRSAKAVEAFTTAATVQGAMGFSLSRIIALTGAARAGAAPQVIGAIDEIADSVDGSCIALLVRQARALARLASLADGAAPAAEPNPRWLELAIEFDEIGDSAARLDMHGSAVEAFVQAAALHRSRGGDDRSGAASARRAAEHVAICGTPLFGRVETVSDHELSDREREIAELALMGRSNREIAEQLVLSVRTVETHLLRVFRKLGVRRRSDLPAAMARGSRETVGTSEPLQPGARSS
jgi:DNA-binding CsgD family transcriptional regulator/tetratricopeptide (TPR) repeat protein